MLDVQFEPVECRMHSSGMQFVGNLQIANIMDAQKDSEALIHLFRHLDSGVERPGLQELLDDPHSITLFLRKIKPQGVIEYQEIVGLAILTRISDSDKGVMTMALHSRYEGYRIEDTMIESMITISRNLGIKKLEILIDSRRGELPGALLAHGFRLFVRSELYKSNL